MKRKCLAILLLLLLTDSITRGNTETPVTLAGDGNARFAIITSHAAGELVQEAAVQLASYLGRIADSEFKLRHGDGSQGIVVGCASDFPDLPQAGNLSIRDPADREAYIIQSHKNGLYILGATDLAAEHAVWDLLYRLGYRQFFPGKKWEFVPRRESIRISLNVTQKPDYLTRRIWYGYGLWDYNKESYQAWCRRNRTVSAFVLDTSHAYEGLIRRNQADFEEHPEYRGLLEGKRTSSKLCIGNPDLRKLIAEHAVRFFEDNPGADSISMDPSDGGGWCECEKCAALGSISDRALTLANCVAESVSQRRRNKYVGMYAYNYHSPPPHVRVHPNVIVSIATSFIKGGYSLDELITGWSQQGATLGMREYFSVHPWDKDLPGRALGSNLEYLQKTIPEYYRSGARFLSAESSDNWGPNGLGYYIASRILWDIDEADHIDRLVEDFLTKSFGPAKEPMASFYEVLDGSNNPLMSDDLIGRMYRYLDQARRLADSTNVKERINDLILYARYVELYQDYSTSKGTDRQTAFEDLIRHGYRMRRTMMVHTRALYRDLVTRDKSVTIPAESSWSVPEKQNPWKSSEPFKERDYQAFLSKGINNHELRGFETKTFSRSLMRAAKLSIPSSDTEFNSVTGRGLQTFYTWVEEPQTAIELKITGGLITHYRNRGNVKVDLWEINEDTPDSRKIVSHGESPPDGKERRISLAARKTGLHKITVDDGNDMTRISWKQTMPVTLVSSRKQPAKFSGRWSLFFYVPEATRIVGLYAEGNGELLDGDGNVVFRFADSTPSYYSIPVPAHQAGKCWKFNHSTGTRILLTVPPCLAPTPRDLLLPREVIKSDSL